MAQIPDDNAGMENSAGSGALQPDIMLSVEAEGIANSSPSFATLAVNQKSVLIAVMMDFLSEDIRSDTQIAADLGINRKTVYNCKVNPAFNTALSQVMPEMVKAKLPKYLANIEKAGIKDWKAFQFLLEYAGLWTKTTRNLNVNANIGGGQGQSMGINDSIDSILIRLGELGWNASRVAQLSERFSELKAEGAF